MKRELSTNSFNLICEKMIVLETLSAIFFSLVGIKQKDVRKSLK
jgi:hypothetical protein